MKKRFSKIALAFVFIACSFTSGLLYEFCPAFRFDALKIVQSVVNPIAKVYAAYAYNAMWTVREQLGDETGYEKGNERRPLW